MNTPPPSDGEQEFLREEDTDEPIMVSLENIRHPSRKWVDGIVTFARAMSDGTRLKILHMLHGGPMNVVSITRALDSSQPAVSHHLAILLSAQLVTSRRDGKSRFYAVTPNASGSNRDATKNAPLMERGVELFSTRVLKRVQ